MMQWCQSFLDDEHLVWNHGFHHDHCGGDLEIIAQEEPPFLYEGMPLCIARCRRCHQPVVTWLRAYLNRLPPADAILDHLRRQARIQSRSSSEIMPCWPYPGKSTIRL